MHVFVTGASGWVGSAVVPELLSAGHTVTGLARSEESAAAVAAAGATVRRGDLTDLDALRAGAAEADAVLHLGYVHDFSDMAAAARTDAAAISTFGDVLAGSGRALVIASGFARVATGRPATEDDRPVDDPAAPRSAAAHAALALAERDVRPVVVRLAPTVHGAGDHGFVAALVGIARERGVSGTVGDGHHRWSAVHRDDAARLFRLAVEHAPAGSVLHGVAEEGVPLRDVAAVVGRRLDVPVVGVPPEEAAAHFGWLGAFLALDLRASSTLTRERTGWTPTGPGLLEDLEAGYYTGDTVGSPA